MSMNPRSVNHWPRFLAGLSVAAILALGSGPALADESGTCTKKKAAKPAATAAVTPEGAKAAPAETAPQAGMKAYIDPATGKLREPTAEDAAAAAATGRQALRAAPAPLVVQHPSGVMSAQLGDEYMNDVVVRKNADGTLVYTCVPRSQREKALATPAPPAKPELEKE
jgi:hypothetical protein